MIEVITILVEHPLTFGFLVLCFLWFIGMTYEFILRLFKRNSVHDDLNRKLDMFEQQDDGIVDEPQEGANVQNPGPPPDTLVAQEKIPEEQDNETVEYVYSNPDRHLWNDWKDKEENEVANGR